MRKFYQPGPFIIGAHCKAGQKKLGVDAGPYLIRTQNRIQSELFESESNYLGYTQLYQMIKSRRKINQTQPIITFGGDHSIGLSTVSAFNDYWAGKGKDLQVIWIDAHADINTPETSSSGSSHGMPVGFLTGLNKAPCPYLKFVNKLRFDQITYIGLRDLDPPEVEFINGYNIKAYTAGNICPQMLDEIKNKTKGKPVHISLDIDSLDPSLAPCTGTTSPNGLLISDIDNIFKTFEPEQLTSLDIAEFNPQIGSVDELTKTVMSINWIFRSFLFRSCLYR